MLCINEMFAFQRGHWTAGEWGHPTSEGGHHHGWDVSPGERPGGSHDLYDLDWWQWSVWLGLMTVICMTWIDDSDLYDLDWWQQWTEVVTFSPLLWTGSRLVFLFVTGRNWDVLLAVVTGRNWDVLLAVVTGRDWDVLLTVVTGRDSAPSQRRRGGPVTGQFGQSYQWGWCAHPTRGECTQDGQHFAFSSTCTSVCSWKLCNWTEFVSKNKTKTKNKTKEGKIASSEERSVCRKDTLLWNE